MTLIPEDDIAAVYHELALEFVTELMEITHGADTETAFQQALQTYVDELRPWLHDRDMRANTLVLSVHTPNLGEAQEEVVIDYQGDALSIGFNGRYLLDFCTAIEPEQQIVMELANEAAPALLRVESDPHYRYVVMPMRL